MNKPLIEADGDPVLLATEDVTAVEAGETVQRALTQTPGGGVITSAGRDLVPKPRSGRRAVDVTKDVSLKIILALALPTCLEQIISAGIGVTDTVVAGHTGGTPEIRAATAAAVGTMTYLQWFAGMMSAALGVGSTAIIARAIGARRYRAANRTAGTSCSSAFLVGLTLAIVFFSFPGAICHLAGLHGMAAEYGAIYLRVMSLTICMQSAGQIGMACLRGAGDTVRPMIVTTCVMLVNAIASPALTFGWFGLPALGIRGNAIGTLLAFAAAGLVTAFFLFSNTAGLKLSARHLKIVPHILGRMLKIGLPSWAESTLLWVGQFVIVIFVISPVDKAIGVDGVTMAAHSAVLRIESLAFLPGFGFGIAASALVGQYLGAKKPDQAERGALLAGRLGLLTMSIAALPMIFCPTFMLRLMVDSEPVVALGKWPLVLAGIAQPIFAIAISRSSAFKGAGDTIWPMLTTITGMALRLAIVFLLAALFAARHEQRLGLLAVWIAIFIDLHYRGGLLWIVFRRGGWKLKKV
jgi:putative MATE family efflux protein